MDNLATFFGRTLVIAPHADDEVLGAGGTISRLAQTGVDVFVAIVTSGRPPAYSSDFVARIKAEALEAHGVLGVTDTIWLDQPAAQLSETPAATLNAVLGDAVRNLAPDTLLVPFPGDIHIDHQLVFRSCLVAAHPHQAAFPRNVLAYETLSETNWNAPYLFPSLPLPLYVAIETSLPRKLDAMRAYKSQLRDSPHERSIETIDALSRLRGATIHCAAAEGFVLVRHAIR